jgi:NCS1 family nucleobase:cation symporter-1
MMGGNYIIRTDYKMYQMTFFIGYPLSATLYIIFSKLFPPQGLGIAEELDGYDGDIIPSGNVIEGVVADYNTEKMVVKEGSKSVDESV